ncbi:MAG: hypothetical protein JST08_12370 [Actinobacteria bacterium]|nr:hypothetical protein [Actinomycetota bacterium]
MLKKTRKIALVGGVLAAVSLGGSALAAAGAAPVHPTRVTVLKHADRETADAGNTDPEVGSETPGNDGPGGHADEPGNPNAQHEAGGQTEE